MSEPVDWAIRDQPLGPPPTPITGQPPAATTAPPRRPVRLILVTVLATLAVIAVAGAGGWWWTHHSSGDTRQQAIDGCEQAVRDQLKSPATAQFSSVVANRDGDRFTISGDVDAQNSFGALLRSTWSCEAVNTAGDIWRYSATVSGG